MYIFIYGYFSTTDCRVNIHNGNEVELLKYLSNELRVAVNVSYWNDILLIFTKKCLSQL